MSSRRPCGSRKWDRRSCPRSFNRRSKLPSRKRAITPTFPSPVDRYSIWVLRSVLCRACSRSIPQIRIKFNSRVSVLPAVGLLAGLPPYPGMFHGQLPKSLSIRHVEAFITTSIISLMDANELIIFHLPYFLFYFLPACGAQNQWITYHAASESGNPNFPAYAFEYPSGWTMEESVNHITFVSEAKAAVGRARKAK